jgi:PKD repeat protein
MGFQAIQHNYPIPGIYKIIMTLVDTNYCNEPESDSVIINVIDRVKANFTPPTTGCLSSGIKFVHNSVGSDDVVWHFGDGSTSNLDTAVHIYNNSGNYTIKLFAYNLFSCNKVDSVSYTISISISPTANFTYNPLPPRVNTAINFTNKSTGAIKYVWSFGDGDTIITNNINQQIKHLFQVNKLFKIVRNKNFTNIIFNWSEYFIYFAYLLLVFEKYRCVEKWHCVFVCAFYDNHIFAWM